MQTHIIGSVRTIRTAVMVTEYLRKRVCQPHSEIQPGMVNYRFLRENEGKWIAEIVVDVYNQDNFPLLISNRFVDTCRAFVAGAGEIWA